jgi:hypothetical protein
MPGRHDSGSAPARWRESQRRRSVRSEVHGWSERRFISIGVINGGSEQNHGVQPVRVFSGSNLSYQRQRGFLSFDFTRVDIGLNVNAQLSGCTNRARRGIADPADNGEGQRAAFEGIAERRVVDQPRLLRYGIEERNDIVVPACLHVVGPLGPGLNLSVQSDSKASTELSLE